MLREMCRMEFGKIWDSQELFGYFAWPTAGRLPDGRLIVVCSGFRMRHVCPFGKVTAFYSDDEGKTWSSPAVLSSSILDNRDAGLCVSGGKVLLTTFTVSRAVQRKYMDMWYRQEGMEKENAFILSYLAMTDDEEELRELGSFIMEGDGYRFGKRRHMPGELSAPHGPFARNGGGFYFAGVKRSLGVDEAPGELAFMESDDGAQWTERARLCIPSSGLCFCECHGVQLPDGKIVVHARVQGEQKGRNIFSVWQCESYDGGSTFTPFRQVIEDGAPPHLLRHSSGALICSYANRTLPHAGPRAAISYDGGESWTGHIVLREDAVGEDIGYPSSVELSDGRILTVFYFTDTPHQDKTALHYAVWDPDEVGGR